MQVEDSPTSKNSGCQIDIPVPSLAEALSSEVGSQVFEAFLATNVRRIAEEKRLIRHVVSF